MANLWVFFFGLFLFALSDCGLSDFALFGLSDFALSDFALSETGHPTEISDYLVKTAYTVVSGAAQQALK